MDKKPIEINLSGIIRSRAGAKGRMIPRCILRAMERLIRQDELNRLLREAFPAEGSAFASRLLQLQDISLHVKGLEALPHDEKFIFACNHPLGGLDGVAMVSVLGSHYGDQNVRVLVNDMLMNVTPLAGVFLPVNKYGSQGRRSATLLNDALESGKQLVMFPAGLVSRLHDDGAIRDLEWQKSFVAKAAATGRRIVPVHFQGLNSMRFYRTARIRKKLHIGFNLEQVLLPAELCGARGKRFTITFGAPVDIAAMRADGMPLPEIAGRLRDACYALGPRS